MAETPRLVPFEPGSGRVVAVALVAALLAAGFWWWSGRSQAVPSLESRGAPAIPASPVAVAAGPAVLPTPAGAPTGLGASPAAGVGGTVTVDVRGTVRRPGLVVLPAGSRVMDAIQAAGGVRGGSRYGSVNLAAVVLDGQQLLVGRRAAVPAGTSPGTASGGAAPPATATGEQLININAATAAELEQLDGIGPVLAQTIVTWRTEQGPFATIEDLLDVSGIGDATLAGMRDQVTVG